MSQRRRTAPFPLSPRAVIGLTLGLLVLAALWWFDAQSQIRTFLDWLRAVGWRGIPLFLFLHALAIVFLFPGILFPLGAGFLFGPVGGTLLSTVGKTLGSVGAFFVARHLLDGEVARERRQAFQQRHPNLALLERKLPESGWRMVALIRMVPVIPYKVSNYFFGWSSFRFRDFLVGTFIGSIPYSFTNAWLGSLAADLSGLTARTVPDSVGDWILYVGASVLAIAAAVAITRRARQILIEAGTPPTEP